MGLYTDSGSNSVDGEASDPTVINKFADSGEKVLSHPFDSDISGKRGFFAIKNFKVSSANT